MIEKLAVVGEMFPADDADLFAMWPKLRLDDGFGMDEYEPRGLLAAWTRARTIVGEPGGEDEPCEKAAKLSGETPSSCMIMDMFDGSDANTDEAALARFRGGGLNASVASNAGSRLVDGGSGDERRSGKDEGSPRTRRKEFFRECEGNARRSDAPGLA